MKIFLYIFLILNFLFWHIPILVKTLDILILCILSTFLWEIIYFLSIKIVLSLYMYQGVSVTSVTSITGHNNHRFTITWILITRTCSHQSVLLQIHASFRHSFTTPNSSQTQCALTCVYLPFRLPMIFQRSTPLFLVPALLRSCNNTHISIQLRLSGLILSSRFSPAICSSQSASIQSINHPVIPLTCCLWSHLWQYEREQCKKKKT